MIRELMAHFEAWTVARPFSAGRVLPEVLCYAFLHDAAHLPAGRVVLYADREVAEARAVYELEFLIRESAAQPLDVTAVGIVW